MKERKRRSPIWLMPREEFITLVSSSYSTTEILKSFGLKNKGGNNRTLWARIRFEGLDEEAIRRKTSLNRQQGFIRCQRPMLNEEVFCENSNYNRTHLKKRIIQQGLLPYVCQICGQLPWWNDKPMILILDHINGIPNDNRLSNLRLVCGNCNVQLDTNAGKSRKSL